METWWEGCCLTRLVIHQAPWAEEGRWLLKLEKSKEPRVTAHLDSRLDWEMPRRLVKHTSRCVFEGVSRDEWQVGQPLRWKTHPECGQQHPIGWGQDVIKMGKESQPVLQAPFFLSEWTSASTCSSLSVSITPATLQGARGPPASIQGWLIGPPCSELSPASWTEQLLGSLTLQGGDYLASNHVKPSNKSQFFNDTHTHTHTHTHLLVVLFL
jgi:hypothetical protein